MNNKGTVDRYSFLSDTDCVFIMAHGMKCDAVVVESTSKGPFALILPMNNKGTVERYSLLYDNECIFKTAHCMKCESVVVESTSKVPFALKGTVERNFAPILFM